MQTLRKLPTMQPRMKKTKDQKWNGTCFQMRGSKIPIHTLLQSRAHDRDGRWLSAPDLKGFGPLVKEHSKAIGDATTRRFGRFQERGFCRPINHVIDSSCTAER